MAFRFKGVIASEFVAFRLATRRFIPSVLNPTSMLEALLLT